MPARIGRSPARSRCLLALVLLLLMCVGMAGATTTVSFYPSGASDGNFYIGSVNYNYTTIIHWPASAGSNTSAQGFVYISTPSSPSGNFSELDRSEFSFNTVLPAGATIQSATLYIAGYQKSNTLTGIVNYGITGGNLITPGIVSKADFPNITRVNLSDTFIPNTTFDITSIAVNNSFPLNAAGIASINTNGWSTFVLTTANDITGTSPAWTASKLTNLGIQMSEAGTSHRPRLDITYTVTSSTYEPLITSFTKTTNGQTLLVNDTSSGFNAGIYWTQTEKAPWVGRYAGVTFNNNGNQIVFEGGGQGAGSVLGDVWKSSDGTNWIYLGTTNYSARYQPAGIWDYGGYHWIAGGYTAGGYTNDVWKSTDGINWTFVGNAPWTGRNEGNFWVKDGFMWLNGGYNSTFTRENNRGAFNDTWKSSDGINWVLVPPSSPTLYVESGLGSIGASIWNYEGNIFQWASAQTLPGNTSYTWNNHLWESSNNYEWTHISNVSITDQNSQGTFIYDNRMYSIGGGDTIGATNETWMSTDGLTWTELNSNSEYLPLCIINTPLVFQNKMWIFGGMGNIVHTDTSSMWNNSWFSPNPVYNWSWGDGTANGTAANSTHTYASPGTYTVCEEVNSILDNQTCQSITTNIITSFTASPPTVLIPQIVTFTDTSTGSPTGWNWSFGDGNWTNSTVSGNTTHSYAAIGTYAVYLIASNWEGSNQSANQSIIATDIPVGIWNLTNSTPGCNVTTWVWNNPIDPTHSNTTIYQNGTFWTVVDNATTSRTWNELPEGTAMTFSAKTCNLYNYCNQTFVNRTAYTDDCGHCSPTLTPTLTPTVAPTGPPTPMSKPCSQSNLGSGISTALLMIALALMVLGGFIIVMALRGTLNHDIGIFNPIMIGVIVIFAGFVLLALSLAVIGPLMGIAGC